VFNHYGLNITLEKPPFPEVPWVYVKDVGTRFPNGRTYSVVMETVGHIGFVNDSPDGGSGYAREGSVCRGREAGPGGVRTGSSPPRIRWPRSGTVPATCEPLRLIGLIYCTVNITIF